jgi:hypothetical protein
MTNFAERGSLGIRQLQPQLGLQDAVFGSQTFVSRQQLLVHRPGDLGEDARQTHESPPPVQSAMAAIDRRKRVAHDRRRGYAERGYCPGFLPFQIFDHKDGPVSPFISNPVCDSIDAIVVGVISCMHKLQIRLDGTQQRRYVGFCNYQL